MTRHLSYLRGAYLTVVCVCLWIANRRAVALDQSEEKVRRGKMHWLEMKRHIYCEQSVWYPFSSTAKANDKQRRQFWQIDPVEDSHRMRRCVSVFHVVV